MNDYNFGNLLYELRNKANLTQDELAKKLGITNKAVSKWENGKAKPTTAILRKLRRQHVQKRVIQLIPASDVTMNIMEIQSWQQVTNSVTGMLLRRLIVSRMVLQ